MMTPCRKLYYAVEAVVYIAYNADNSPVSSRDIARMQGLPSRHLEQIMQRLVHGRVLKGMRGPKGGYLLAKGAETISVGEICALVNEEDIITLTPDTTNIGIKVVRPFWSLLHQEILEKLNKISVADLCLQATEKQVARASPLKMAGTFNSALVSVLMPYFMM